MSAAASAAAFSFSAAAAAAAAATPASANPAQPPPQFHLRGPDGGLHSSIFVYDVDDAIKNGKDCSEYEEGVLAIFCDGSASEPYNEHGDRYCSCSAVYRKDRTSRWVEVGKMLLHITGSGNAEVCALDSALAVGLDKVKEHPGAITVVKILTDFMPVLDALRRLTAEGGSSEICHGFDQETMQSIVDRDAALKQCDVTVEIYWVKSHHGVPGNKIADRVAKAWRPDKRNPDKYRVRSRPRPTPSKVVKQQKPRGSHARKIQLEREVLGESLNQRMGEEWYESELKKMLRAFGQEPEPEEEKKDVETDPDMIAFNKEMGLPCALEQAQKN
ncbi:hypothetical protein SLS58_005082 [Diplodia intermedia]|uniref:RNase H type-1 domain-containing protein n=1 Tax=Diplodia intermedia TaxID=856260 RepID=A0ABR3TRV4_9PEZI